MKTRSYIAWLKKARQLNQRVFFIVICMYIKGYHMEVTLFISMKEFIAQKNN